MPKASYGCVQASIMKFSHVATALLLVTALVTVTNLLHLPHHDAAPAGDKDAALRAEIDALAAAAKAGEAFAREPPPPAIVPAPPAPIIKPPPPKSNFAGTTVAIVKPNLYDHGHTFGEFKIFSAIMWGAQELGAKTVVVKNRADAAALKGNIIVVSDQYTDDALKRAVSTKRRYNVDFWGTPQQQVARGTKVNEYLVPYPYPCGNTMIGFRRDTGRARGTRIPSSRARLAAAACPRSRRCSAVSRRRLFSAHHPYTGPTRR